MKVKFKYKLSQQDTSDLDDSSFVIVEAEVLNVGIDTETVFISSVTGSGVLMLWALKPSELLFSNIQKAAANLANKKIAEIDQWLTERVN